MYNFECIRQRANYIILIIDYKPISIVFLSNYLSITTFSNIILEILCFFHIFLLTHYNQAQNRAKQLFQHSNHFQTPTIQYQPMQHEHGPNCGCKDYMGVENANDLLGAIDIDKVTCLNEQVAGSGKSILKDFDSRFDKEKFVRSDCDGQVLLVVPFVAQVKIRSICVISKGESKYPTVMRLYVNNENINFSLTEHQPVQQFPLNANLSGDINHAVKINKFKSVHKLIIHLKNENQQNIQISYIQIKGENTNIKRQAVQTVYEIQPNAEKKDLKDLNKMGYEMH